MPHQERQVGMSRRFEVVGDVMGRDDDEMNGDVMGNVAAQVVGYDDNGYPIVVSGRRRRPTMQLTQPGWRQGQIAPGVIAPDEGLETLPMGNFTYTAAAQTNTFSGQVQKPFRGERWLIRVVRTGASAVGVILAQLFAGTDLAQLDVASIDLESLAAGGNFGTRLTHKPIQPGVFMRAITTLSSVLAGTDTIFTSLQLLGRRIA
jgi:hypothetical protein